MHACMDHAIVICIWQATLDSNTNFFLVGSPFVHEHRTPPIITLGMKKQTEELINKKNAWNGRHYMMR